MKKRSDTGFTLIELLVAISIIGMLASTVLIATTKARNNANNARIQEGALQLRNAIELGYLSGVYSNLVSDTEATSTAVITHPLVSTNMTALVNDILVMNGGLYGASPSNVGQTCGAPVLVRRYCVNSGYIGGACGSGNPSQNQDVNGLTIFTDNPSPNNCSTNSFATKYAIFASYKPIGRAGYFCVDHTHNTVHRTTGRIPQEPGGNVTCI